MNRNQAKELLPVIKAFSEGKTTQFMGPKGIWEDRDDISFICAPEYYRIKPESKYRPFKDAEECWQEMQKHQPFGWLKDKKDGHRVQILSVSDGINLISSTNLCYDFKHRMDLCTFDDGAPFGIKVEE